MDKAKMLEQKEETNSSSQDKLMQQPIEKIEDSNQTLRHRAYVGSSRWDQILEELRKI